VADTRRSFLALVGLAPIALLAAGSGSAAEPAACYDPAKLPLSQKSRRRANDYVDHSPDPAKHCSLCNFFTSAEPGCGTCQILGGPVNAGAVCASFAAKAKS
jgi:hypothetical protein